MYLSENTYECLLHALRWDRSYTNEPETPVHMYCGVMDEGLFGRVCASVCPLHIYMPGFEGIYICVNLKVHR